MRGVDGKVDGWLQTSLLLPPLKSNMLPLSISWFEFLFELLGLSGQNKHCHASFDDKIEHERSRWEGGWMAADKPAPSSTLKLPARTNRDLLELGFLQSLNFKKSSFPKCFLKVHHHFASQVVRAHQIIQSDKVSFHRYWHFGTTSTWVGASLS